MSPNGPFTLNYVSATSAAAKSLIFNFSVSTWPPRGLTEQTQFSSTTIYSDRSPVDQALRRWRRWVGPVAQ
jgi:hypothetical protein